MSILVVGSIVLDTVRSPYGETDKALGGSAIYFSGTASRFTEVRLVGVVGEDFPEEGMRFLADRKVDLEGLQTLPGETFAYECEYGWNPNDRLTIDTRLNVFEGFHPKLPERYRDTPVLFLGNIAPALQEEVLDQMKCPKHVAADTMNYWIKGDRAGLERLLRRVDTLFLNDSEAMELTGEKNLVKAIRRVTEFGPSTVVAKKGEHGAVLYRNGAFFAVPAYPVETVRDPTGGGDSFAGGMLGRLAGRGSFDDSSFREAMLHGTAIASFVVEDFGPRRLESLTDGEYDERVRTIRSMITI
ncbi:MAG: sugar kinase [Candidatus Eisenbacteria bacterium]|nr:sugar kinase [Candidatus Eisenbacteria bacterium]